MTLGTNMRVFLVYALDKKLWFVLGSVAGNLEGAGGLALLMGGERTTNGANDTDGRKSYTRARIPAQKLSADIHSDGLR